ncbi:MAG: hypothetical protein ACYC18_08810 [Gammaproteobacteria bacterium]
MQPRTRLSVDAAILYRYAPLSNGLIQVSEDRLTLDAAGNTVADQDGARTFTCDAAGHLSAVYDHHHWIATYRYNAFGLRTEKRTQAGTTLYRYDPRRRHMRDAEGQVHRDYVWRNRCPWRRSIG